MDLVGNDLYCCPLCALTVHTKTLPIIHHCPVNPNPRPQIPANTPALIAERLLSAIRARHAAYPPDAVRPLAEIEADVKRIERDGTLPKPGCPDKLAAFVLSLLARKPNPARQAGPT
jgi:hypothetical protein